MSENENTQDLNRPEGKRQVTGVATSSELYEAKKVAEAKAKEEGSKEHTVASFLPEVVSEMRKVIWQTPKQLAVSTAVVLVFLIVVTGLVAGVDFLAGLGVEKILNPQ